MKSQKNRAFIGNGGSDSLLHRPTMKRTASVTVLLVLVNAWFLLALPALIQPFRLNEPREMQTSRADRRATQFGHNGQNR